MRKTIKWTTIILAVAGAAFLAFNLFLGAKKKGCLEGEGAQAVEACTFLINDRTSRDRGDYLAGRARLLEKEEKWDEALSDLNEITAMKYQAQVPPDRFLAAYEALVKSHQKKGGSSEVKKYLELAAQNGSKKPEIYISLAVIYVEAKKFREALSLLETAGGLDKAKTHPYYNAQASAYEGLDDFGKAYTALREGLTVPAPRPVLAATSKRLGLVCFELKRYKEAEIYLGYALRAGSDCPECGLLLTTIRKALGPTAEPAGRAKRPRK